MPSISLVPARTTAVLAALTALFVAAPAANAKKPVENGCGYTGTAVFAPWNDDRNYTLVPDGGFENGGSDWTLDGGAAAAEGNETFQVGGPDDHRSLALPADSSATSPSICVSKHDDVFRLFARTDGGRKARLQVDVIYSGSVHAFELRGDDAWAPTRDLAVKWSKAKDGDDADTGSISLRFTPLAGNWQIDDVYLDPRLRY